MDPYLKKNRIQWKVKFFLFSFFRGSLQIFKIKKTTREVRGGTQSTPSNTEI